MTLKHIAIAMKKVDDRGNVNVEPKVDENGEPYEITHLSCQSPTPSIKLRHLRPVPLANLILHTPWHHIATTSRHLSHKFPI